MTKRIRTGVLLMLIGIGIPLVLIFFQNGGELFKMNIEKYDKLRDEEVKTLNSIYTLSKSIKEILSELEKNAPAPFSKTKKEAGPPSTIPLDVYFVSTGMEEMKKVINEIEDFLKKALISNVHMQSTDGKLVRLPPGYELVSLEGIEKFVISTSVNISIGIPYKYSVGIGVLIFLTGIGIVILSLIGRKGRPA